MVRRLYIADNHSLACDLENQSTETISSTQQSRGVQETYEQFCDDINCKNFFLTTFVLSDTCIH